MSEVETYMGTLAPVDLGGKTPVEWMLEKLDTKDLLHSSVLEAFEEKYPNQYFYHEKKETLYRVTRYKLDSADFEVLNKNENGTIDYVVSFHNGGTFFDAVIENLLEKA